MYGHTNQFSIRWILFPKNLDIQNEFIHFRGSFYNYVYKKNLKFINKKEVSIN